MKSFMRFNRFEQCDMLMQELIAVMNNAILVGGIPIPLLFT